MGTLTYPNKTVSGNGTSSYVEGKTLPASELQADFDAVATVINGNIDNSNISGSAAIAVSKLAQISGSDIDDYSADATEAAVTVTPGDSDTLGSNLATTFDDEVERLRYRIGANRGYGGTIKYADSSGTLQDAAWVEPNITGSNLLVNSGFEGDTALAAAPYGWTDNASTTFAIADAAVDDGGDARHLKMTGGTNDGIKQTVYGVKANTKYVFGVTYVRTSGTIQFVTSGGLAAGNAYQDPSYTDNTNTDRQTINLIVQSDASGTDIEVAVLMAAGTNEVDLVESWFYEIDDAKHAGVPTGLIRSASHSTAETLPAAAWTGTGNTFRWEEVTELAISQYVPSPGYRLIYTATLSAEASVSAANQGWEHGYRLKMDGNVVDGPYLWKNIRTSGDDSRTAGQIVTLMHVVDYPETGTTYDFTVEVGAYDASGYVQMSLSPLSVDTSTQSVSQARLRLERI